MITGVLCAVIAAAIARFSMAGAWGLVFLGGTLYLPGGFLTVSHFDFKRGTKIFWAMSMMRLLFAAAVMLTITQSLTQA